MAGLVDLDLPPDLKEPVTLIINSCSDPDSLSVTIECNDSALDNPDIDIRKKDQHKSIIVFKPPTPDIYTISVKQGAENVTGFPLRLNLSEPNAEGVQLTQPPTGKVKAGHDLSVIFDTFKAGRGNLTATCVGSGCGDIDVFVTRQGFSCDFKVFFLPLQEDKYTLNVLFAGRSVKGSPFIIDLTPVNAKKVVCSQPRFPEGLNGPVEVDICTKDAGTSAVVAKCSGKTCGKVDVDIKRSSEFDYLLKFDPPGRDVFELSIKYGGRSVKNSPIIINTYPTDSSKVKVTEPEGPAEVGKVLSYKADATQAGNGSLQAKCTRTMTGNVPVDTTLEGFQQYNIAFEPKEKDVYTLDVMWEGKGVKGSPFEKNMLSIEDVSIGEIHVPKEAGSDENVWVEVDISKAGNAAVEGTCSGEKGDNIPVSISKLDLGKFKVEFCPKVSDLYTLVLYYNKEPIPNGTFKVDLHSDPKLVRHLDTTIPPEDSLDAAARLTFDASGAGNGSLNGRVIGITHAGEVPCEVKLIDEEAKKYEISFVPDKADMYHVNVEWTDKAIPNSPFPVKVVHASEVKVAGPVGPELMHPVKINIDTEYAGPGILSAVCTCEKMGKVDISIAQNGSDHTISFHPITADLYQVRIFFSDIEIKQSPLEIDLRKQTPPSSLPVTPTAVDEITAGISSQDIDESIEHDKGDAPDLIVPTRMDMVLGHPLDLVFASGLSSTDTDNLVAVASGEVTGPVEVSIVPSESKGSYTLNFNPTKPDTYTIEVKVNDVNVPGSPFIIVCREPTSSLTRPNAHLLISPELIPAPTHPITRPYLIQYIPNSNTKNIQAYAIHDASCTRKILKVLRSGNGRSFLAFSAENTGLHFIHIKHGTKEIQGSPFRLEIVSSDPSAAKVMDLPEKVYTGDEVSFKVDSSKAGMGDLHVIAAVPTGGKDAGFTHADDGSGVFTIKFIPRVPGRYKLDINWADIPIPESPICIQVDKKVTQNAASRVFVMDNKYVFKSRLSHLEGASFHISTEKAGQGTLTVKAQGPANLKIDLFREKAGLFRCDVNPVVSGRYNVVILWEDRPVPGHPYVLDFTARKTYTINNLDLEVERFLLDRPCEFYVNSVQEVGELEVQVSPSDAAEVDVHPLKGKFKSYRVRMTPKVPGNHEVSVKFAGSHVLQSPYHVQFESALTSKQDQENPSSASATRENGHVTELRRRDLGHVTWEKDEDPATTEVLAFGPGLTGGVIGQEGNFIIKTSGAGEGILDVNISGARGTFKTQLRHHPEDSRTILARYDPTNVGEYTIDVKWLDKHVKGSPFRVSVKPQEME